MKLFLSAFLLFPFCLSSHARLTEGDFETGTTGYSDLIRMVEISHGYTTGGGTGVNNHPDEYCPPEELLLRESAFQPIGRSPGSSFAPDSEQYETACLIPALCRTRTNNRTVAGGSGADRLANIAWNVAGERLPTSNTYRRRGGAATLQDRWRSGLACAKAVRYAVSDYLGRPREGANRLGWALHAKDTGPALRAAGFQQVSGCTAANAPNGAVMVYSGGRSGHIEIKVVRGGEDYYCSDYCGQEPRSASGTRRFQACYLPPGA